jgi:hypothetical protein
VNESSYAVVWPRGKIVNQEGRLAKRLGTLDGKTIGFMWNGVFFGDKMFPVIEKELAGRYSQTKFVRFEVFSITQGQGDITKVIAASPDKLKRYNCDAVISGVGC